MNRYVCIHGHFYQPPRQNAWLEYVEVQNSAQPFHDWNERVTDECYTPNTAARILDKVGSISQITNNYSKISFDFGPTLLSWLEQNAPETYHDIIKSDQESQTNFSGHGSAVAGVYNHMILPLANQRDKYTQVLWGIRDFEWRFGRKPEGMALPELAVDLETLDIMAAQGIKFTFLAPHQAKRVRRISSHSWQEVIHESIDTSMPYRLDLPSGRSLSIFFYNGNIAHAVAFDNLLRNGEEFARRLNTAFSTKSTKPQLVHIVTDGETYGHHHRFGDMALAYAISYLETNLSSQMTNYAEYLEKYPPTFEVEIVESTSWSCFHGVERWRSDCGCQTGGQLGWNQAWREPLRQSLDWLRDKLAPDCEEKTSQFLKDPWLARNEYIEVILNRSPENVQQFLNRNAKRELDKTEKVTVLKLLELQRYSMLMYASDGWFFADISGIESVQNMQYMARAVQLAEELFGEKIESRLLKILEAAKSNLPEYSNGRCIYEEQIKPSVLYLNRVTANYAASSVFEKYPSQTTFYCYTVDIHDYQALQSGKARLATGWAKIASKITLESTELCFAALFYDGHNLNAGVGEYHNDKTRQEMFQKISQAFSANNFSGVNHLIDQGFTPQTYSFESLLPDEQSRFLRRITESTLSELETVYRPIFEQYHYFMPIYARIGNPLLSTVRIPVEFVINADLRHLLTSEAPDLGHVRSLLDEAREWNIKIDTENLGPVLQKTLEDMIVRFGARPEGMSLLNNIVALMELGTSFPLPINPVKIQNIYYKILHNLPLQLTETWATKFTSLGHLLSIRVT